MNLDVFKREIFFFARIGEKIPGKRKKRLDLFKNHTLLFVCGNYALKLVRDEEKAKNAQSLHIKAVMYMTRSTINTRLSSQ